jgi:hypothetical protein
MRHALENTLTEVGVAVTEVHFVDNPPLKGIGEEHVIRSSRQFERAWVTITEAVVYPWGKREDGTEYGKLIWEFGPPPRPVIHIDFIGGKDSEEENTARILLEKAFDNRIRYELDKLVQYGIYTFPQK